MIFSALCKENTFAERSENHYIVFDETYLFNSFVICVANIRKNSELQKDAPKYLQYIKNFINTIR